MCGCSTPADMVTSSTVIYRFLSRPLPPRWAGIPSFQAALRGPRNNTISLRNFYAAPAQLRRFLTHSLSNTSETGQKDQLRCMWQKAVRAGDGGPIYSAVEPSFLGAIRGMALVRGCANCDTIAIQYGAHGDHRYGRCGRIGTSYCRRRDTPWIDLFPGRKRLVVIV